MAGVGDVLLSDDGFGVEVARRLAREPLPPGVRVVDYGIRALQLAHELLYGCDLFVLIDTVQRGGDAGTVYVIESDGSDEDRPRLVDEQDVSLDTVLGVFRTLGGGPERIVVVGCEPADVGAGVGLTGPVARAVDHAVAVVLELLGEPRNEATES